MHELMYIVCMSKASTKSRQAADLSLDIDPFPFLDILTHLCLDIIDIINTNHLVALPPRLEVFHSSEIESHSLTFFIESCAEMLTKLNKLRAKST
jgi:hypothetical protein